MGIGKKEKELKIENWKFEIGRQATKNRTTKAGEEWYETIFSRC